MISGVTIRTRGLVGKLFIICGFYDSVLDIDSVFKKNYQIIIHSVHRGMGSFYMVGVPSGGNLSRTIGGKTDKIGFKGFGFRK